MVSGQLDLSKYFHDHRWNEVLLLMAGNIGTWAIAQATRLVGDILISIHNLNYLHRNLLFVADILADNVRIKRNIVDEIVLQIIKLGISTPHEILWNAVINRLSEIAKVIRIGTIPPALQFQKGDKFETKVRKSVIRGMIEENIDEVFGLLLLGMTKNENISKLIEPYYLLLFCSIKK